MDKDAERLAELQREEKVKYLHVAVEEVEGQKLAIASEETVDRQGEIITLDGWDLKNFKRNPVMLWSHNPYEPNLGHGKNMRLSDVNGKRKLVFEPDFHKITPLSQALDEMYEKGYLRAFSVGFLPLEMEPVEKDGDSWGPQRYLKQELLEISAVNVPAHPNALNIAYAKGLSEGQAKLLFLPTEDSAPDQSAELAAKVKALEAELAAFREGDETEQLKLRIQQLENELAAAKALPRTDQQQAAQRRMVRAIDRMAEKLLRSYK
jgi:phage head maturation protease